MSTFAPTTKADLATAVQAWVTNGTAATTTYGHISTWNVSAITDMSSLCMNKTNFNGDIANWNVSNVTDMSNMFNGVNAFNRGIGIWDVSKVRNMQGMFGNTQYSSMALNAWNVSNVTNMTSMFSGSIRYDQNFRGWSVQPSTILTSMFSGATAMITNQGVSTTPSYTYFNKASAPTYQAITTRAQLDAAITAWIANSVTAAVTYGDINTWDIFTITDMSNLFSGKSTFNSNISGWNVSRVTNMSGMFNGAVAFNQPINSWTVNRVTNMSSMFMNASAFNLNISGWIVGRATLFSDMFSGATAMIANQGAAITPLYTYFTQAPNTLPTGSVTISGTPTQKLVLTVLNTLADADGLGPFTYQWKRAGSNISGAIGSTYTLVQGDVGFAITVTVSYIDLQGTVESITSSATAAVANANDIATGSVTISGSPIQNQVLTASNTLVDIDGLGPITYQWKRGGVTISGATGSTYTLVQGDVGFAITVTASYTDLLGSAESATSAATAIIAPAPIVTISGSATQREFLTAETNGITDVGSLGAFSYQWKRSSTLGVAGSNILVDAIGSTYQLIQDDVNKYITVTVSYTDVLEQIKTITSDATSAVINMNDIATGWPVINGTATQGKVLTVDTTGIGDVDGLGTFEYKWLRKSTAAGQSYSSIPGATSDTYKLTPDDVSKYIMVTVKFTDGGGSIEVRASDATAAVAPFVPLPTATRGQLDAAVTAWCSDSIAATDVYGPISSWDVSAITDMSTLFTAKVSFNSDISAWNVSNVTNMQSMFDSAFAFNQPLNAWNVSNVTNMDSMFRDNYIFNQPLNTWSVSRVTNMRGMFRGAYVFNQDISTWNVSIVTDMVGMFLNAREFNWNIRGWYVGQATLRTDMFLGATAMLATPDTIATPPYTYFTQAPVANTPPTGSVTITGTATQNQILTASHTLADANGPVTLTVSYQWKRSLSSSVAGSNISLNATSSTYTLVPDDVGKYITVTVSYTDGLTNAESVTSGSTEVVAPFVPLPTATRGQLDAAVTAWCSDSIAATDVYGPISSWDVSAITDMSTLFTAKVSFNSDISAWNVSNVTNMQSMFDSAFAFNQPLNAWNVSNVTNMDSMFRDNYIFNQPLNTWSVSRVTNMRGMFRGAYVFNQDISTWNVSIVTDMVGMFLNAREFNWNIRGWYVGQATLRTDMFLGATAMLATPDTIATPPYTYFTQAPVANTPPTGSVTITGTATQNQILTASHTLADANGPVTLTVSYQWKRSLSSSVAGSNISLNATSSTYTLVPDDVGKYITVTVSYTDGLTNAESVTSGSTEVVAPFVPLPTAPTESVNKSCDFVLPTLNASFELLQALSIVGNYGAPAPFALPTITLPMSASLFNDGLFHLELVDSNIHTLLDPATEAVYFSEKITYYADDAKFPELKSNGNKYLRELPVMNGSASTSTHLRQRNADVDGLAASMVHELAYQLTGISLMDDQLANGVSLRTVIDNYITTALPAALKSKLAACNGKTQNISGASDMTDQRNVPRELFMQIVESVVGDRNGTHLAKSSRLNTLFHSSNFAGGKYGIKFIAGDTLRFTVTISPSANHIDYIVDGMPHAVQETRAVEVIITMM